MLFKSSFNECWLTLSERDAGRIGGGGYRSNQEYMLLKIHFRSNVVSKCKNNNPRAEQRASAGRIWFAGRSLPTPILYHDRTKRLCYYFSNNCCELNKSNSLALFWNLITLAICGDYHPEKFGFVNTFTVILGLWKYLKYP